MPKPSPYRVLRIGAASTLALLAASAAFFASGLQIEQDNASMQSNQALNDPAYTEFKQAFDTDSELVLTITRPDVFSVEEAERLRSDVEWLQSLEGIHQVYCPTPPHAVEGFVSADHQTVGLLLALRRNQTREERVRLLNILRTETPEQIEGSVEVVGLPLVKERVAHHVARDQMVVTPLSLAVMVLILAVLFRRVVGVVLPMLVVGLSLLCTLGLYAACGFELNSITSLLPPVVIVLSVSVAVHLFDAWNHEIRSGACGDAAIRSALSKVWKPCVFTAAMTAMGLLSLHLSPIPAVRLFGLFSAIGVLLSVAFAFVVFPVGLGWIRERADLQNSPWMDRFVHTMAEWPGRFPKTILLIALLISAASLWEAGKIQNNTDLIRFFKKSDPTYRAHAEVNRTLGSVRSIDLLIQHADGSPFNPAVDRVPLSRLSEKIEAIPDVVRTDSVADFAPGVADVPSPLLSRFVADDGRMIRMQIHLGDIGSARAAAINEDVLKLSHSILGRQWLVRPTGDYYQMVRDSNQLVATLVKSFSLSLAVVMGSISLLFRSLRVLVPAFIPNILPIIWGAGLMGLVGIDLSTGTAMVAAVVIGLAVDDTVHYLHHFQSFRHLPIREATRATTRHIGHALTASTVVLVGGFWMGAFGSFIPTNTFSLLTGCMMVSALFCDLLVLPAYLNLRNRNHSHG